MLAPRTKPSPWRSTGTRSASSTKRTPPGCAAVRRPRHQRGEAAHRAGRHRRRGLPLHARPLRRPAGAPRRSREPAHDRHRPPGVGRYGRGRRYHRRLLVRRRHAGGTGRGRAPHAGVPGQGRRRRVRRSQAQPAPVDEDHRPAGGHRHPTRPGHRRRLPPGPGGRRPVRLGGPTASRCSVRSSSTPPPFSTGWTGSSPACPTAPRPEADGWTPSWTATATRRWR